MDKLTPRQTVEKILKSETFANKEVLKGLLNYLAESAEKGLVIKEIDIASGYFRRGNEFIPGDDTIVRVNIHKLRSLLERYYQTDGKKDDWVVEIPRGTYGLNFIKKSSKRYKVARRRNSIRIIVAVLAISLLGNVLLLFHTNIFDSGRFNPVWGEYIKSGQPVYITLADPFFFRVNDSADETIIARDITINSADELAQKPSNILGRQGSNVAGLTYPYFSTNNVWPLPDIISVFAKSRINVRLKALSESNVEDITRYNEIFIGNINSFGYINKFLDQTSIRLLTNPRKIIIKKERDSLVLSVPEYIHGYYTDYAIFVKIPGPNNNLLTIMGDFHASGIKGLTNFITNSASLSELERKVKKDFGRFPEYFEMVVKVVSYNYADFKTELIYFKPINSNITF